MKTRYFIFYVLYFMSHISYSQNLVPNYSFESLTSCPGSIVFSQVNKATPWFRPTSGTPDIYNVCATNAQSGVPINAAGNQFPLTGNGYVGLAIKYGNNFREYIEAPLITKLINNKKYCGALNVSLADTCNWSGSSIGIYFSKDSIFKDTTSSFSDLIGFIPQIQNPINNFISEKFNWVSISGIFAAQGGERFITIGNFYNDVNTPIQSVPGSQPYSYYYIDDVSVIELPEANELAGGNKVICPGDSVLLGTTQKMNVGYTWQGNGIVGSGSSQVWVKPTATSTYTLAVSDTSVVCENSSIAVVTVIVKTLTVGSSSWQSDTTICEGRSILIGGAGKPNYAYTWSPATTLNNANIAKPTATPQQSTTYYLTTADTSFGYACNTVTDSVKITVINCDTVKPNSFWVSNAFSPNGDNNNEILYVYGKNIQDLQFEIYNRWGEKIFEQNCHPSLNFELPAPNCKSWDGKINNENSPESVYVWYAKVKFKDDEEKTYKGSVILLR